MANAAVATGATAHVPPHIINSYIITGATATAATPQANAQPGTGPLISSTRSCALRPCRGNAISPDGRMHRTDGETIVGGRTNILAKLKQLITLTMVAALVVTSVVVALVDNGWQWWTTAETLTVGLEKRQLVLGWHWVHDGQGRQERQGRKLISIQESAHIEDLVLLLDPPNKII